MIVLNWTVKTSGFYTRRRSDQKSQLDLVLVDRDLYPRIRSMTIDRATDFGSDHCILDVRLHSTLPTSHKRTPHTTKVHNWSQDCQQGYDAALTDPITSWIETTTSLNHSLTHMDKHQRAQNITTITNQLTDTIKNAYNSTVPNYNKTHDDRPRRAPSADHKIRLLLSDREIARKQYEHLCSTYATEDKINEAREQQKQTTKAVSSYFMEIENDHYDSIAKDMEPSYDDDKTLIFSTTQTHLEPQWTSSKQCSRRYTVRHFYLPPVNCHPCHLPSHSRHHYSSSTLCRRRHPNSPLPTRT